MLKKITGRCAAFGRAADGGVTVEFVLWLPVFLGLILLSADASLLFMRQSMFWEVSRDTARIVSRHGLNAPAAQQYAQNHASLGGYQPHVSVDVDPSAATVTVVITAEARALAPFGILGLTMGDKVSTRVTQTMEPI